MAKPPQWTCSCGTKAKSLFLDVLPPVRLPLSNPALYPKAGSLSPPFIGTQPLPAFLLQWTSDARGRSTGSTKSIEPSAQFVRLLIYRSGLRLPVRCIQSIQTSHNLGWLLYFLYFIIASRILPGHCVSMRDWCRSNSWDCLLHGSALLVSKHEISVNPMMAYGQILMYGYLESFSTECALRGRSYVLTTHH